MPSPAPETPALGPSSSLQAPRKRFLSSLPERLAALEQGVSALHEAPSSAALHGQLKLRLEAMEEACQALGLDSMETAFASLQSALARATGGPSTARALSEMSDTLKLIPSLAPQESQPSPAVELVARDSASPRPKSFVVPRPEAADDRDTPDHTEAPDGPEDAGEARFDASSERVSAHAAPSLEPQVRPEAETEARPTPWPSTLPKLAPPTRHNADQAARRPRADVGVVARRRVLVADADPAMAWFLAGVLRSAHADVIEAREGLEAWQLAQEHPPDLVVSDLDLPELDGFGLCRNLKRDVVLCSVPVLLVSWKEDTLQRARELGAGADGYFLKEAEAPTILRRCAEALEKRANVERRLREEEVVVGRLDGMTPYLVLRLVCDVLDNARITFEDAGHRYVVHVGEGRLLDARRSKADAASERGSDVLGPLLGMRAGRFLVERERDPVQSAFSGSLSWVLAPQIRKIRRAAHVVQGKNLHHIARLELDETALSPYLAASPSVARKLMSKLQSGVAPASLLRSVSASLLESVLIDLAQRGAVRHALDVDGNDLLQRDEQPELPFDLDVRTPTAGYALAAAPGAPRIGAASSAADVAAAAEFAERRASAQAAELRRLAPSTLPDELGPVNATEPAPPPADEARGAHAAAATHAEALEPSYAERAEPSAEPELPEPRKHAPALDTIAALRPDSAEPAPRELSASHTPEASEASELGVERALAQLEELRQAEAPQANAADDVPAGSRTQEGPPAVEATPSVEAIDLASAVFGELSASPPAAKTSRAQKPLAAKASPARASGASARAVATKSRDELLLARSLRSSDPVTKSLSPRDSEPSTRQAPQLRQAHQTLPSGSMPTPAKAPTSTATTEDPLQLWVNQAHRWSVSAGQWLSASRRKLRRTLTPAQSRNTSEGAALERPDAETGAEFTTGAPTLQASQGPLSEHLEEGARTQRRPPRVTSFTDKLRATARDKTRWLAPLASIALPAASVLGAGTLAFWGATVAFSHFSEPTTALSSGAESTQDRVFAPEELPLAGPDEDALDLAAEEQDLGLAPPGRAKAQPRLEMHSVELPLPEGIEVAAGKGLLEINTAGSHKIYVDKVFVGRGPVRRVPLTAGAHQLELRLDGDIESASVQIVAGKRIRFEPLASAQVKR